MLPQWRLTGKFLSDVVRRLLAASVSTRQRQEADFRRVGRAGQGQLAATAGETR
jgi:hypothetical protein